MANRLFLIRGLPGAGKTTLGAKLSRFNFSSDDFFIDPAGHYKKDLSKSSDARLWCLGQVFKHLIDEDEDVVVTGTFCKKEDIRHYKAITKSLSIPIIIIDLYDSGLSDCELAARIPGRATREHITQMRSIYER